MKSPEHTIIEGFAPKLPPMEHQLHALKLGCFREYFAYLMDRGTGKTKTTLDNAAILYICGLIKGLVVIAPNGVHERWVSEQIQEHMPDYIKLITRVWENRNSKKYIRSLEELFHNRYEDHLKILTINVEGFVSEKVFNLAGNFLKAFPSMLVVDESTRIKTHKAKRTKRILKLTKYADYRRILTGNEITKTPFEAYTQMKFLKEDFWDGLNYWVFQKRYAEYQSGYVKIKQLKASTKCSECGRSTKPKVVRYFDRKKDNWSVYFKCTECGEKIKSANKVTTNEARRVKKKGGLREFPILKSYKNLDELKEKIDACSFRVKKEECMDLPPKIYDPIYVKMNDQQRKAYNDLKDNLVSSFNGSVLEVLNRVSLFIRHRQIVGGFFPNEDGDSHFLGSPKLDALLYHIEDDDPEVPTIIWTVYTDEIKLITSALKKEYPEHRTQAYYGEIPKKQRPQIISDFQEGSIRFFVANPSVGGTGLNLQRSNIHYFYSQTDRSEDRWQAEDRSHRKGTHWPVVYRDIYMRGTVDITLKKIVQDNKNLAEFFAGKNPDEALKMMLEGDVEE